MYRYINSKIDVKILKTYIDNNIDAANFYKNQMTICDDR